MTKTTWTTSIAEVRSDDVIIRGHRLSDLVGSVTYSDMAFLLIRGNLPDRNERAMLEAILVSLADHGISPSTIVARTLTSCGTPVQASMAGAALSIADWHGGSGEEVADILDEISTNLRANGIDLDLACRNAVGARLGQRRQVPGFGHPQHTDGDPRARQLLGLCHKLGLTGPHTAALSAVGRALAEATGAEALRAPNITGAVAGILMDLGFPPESIRGIVIAARSLGLTAHIVEELQQGNKWRHAPSSDVSYTGPHTAPGEAPDSARRSQ